MKRNTKQLLTVIVIVLVALGLYAGSAFAQDNATATTPTPSRLQQMQERLGLEGWGQMVQRMTQRHGAEFTSQMMQRMAQQEGCPCLDGASCEPGMGQGMMQQGHNGMNSGMMGHKMRGQDTRRWGFNQFMGPRFWHSTPPAAPTATPAE